MVAIRDITKLYQVETKRVNEAVKNNPDKFPERFSWVLTNEETKGLRSKISILEIKGQGKYSKYVPRVFTEQGLYMLAIISYIEQQHKLLSKAVVMNSY